MNNRVKYLGGGGGGHGRRYWYRAIGSPNRVRKGWAYAILENIPAEQEAPYQKKELESLKRQAQYYRTILENINRKIELLVKYKSN